MHPLAPACCPLPWAVVNGFCAPGFANGLLVGEAEAKGFLEPAAAPLSGTAA